MNKGDTILVYKILYCFLVGVQWCEFFLMADSSRPRKQSMKLKKERAKLDLRKLTLNPRAFIIPLEAQLKNLPKWLSQ